MGSQQRITLCGCRSAKIAGMESDLRLVNEQYDWLLTIFYITYVLGEFQALMWKIVPPHQWAAFVVFGWYASLRRDE